MLTAAKPRPDYHITRHNSPCIGKHCPPLAKMRKITAQEHADYFNAEFMYRDVWTADGWLVTSSFGGDGLQSGLRKATAVAFAHFEPETPLYVDYC